MLSFHVSLGSQQDGHEGISIGAWFFRRLIPTGPPFYCHLHSSENLHWLGKKPTLDWDQFISHKLCSQKLPETVDCQTHFYLFLIIPEVSCISAETSYARCLHQAFWFDTYFNWTFQLFLNIRLGGKKKLLHPNKKTFSSEWCSISMLRHTTKVYQHMFKSTFFCS